nr:hypothetical protein [Tanacetum cinerariifolium]
MLEEMVGISLDSMLDKWHKISKDTMHGRMVGFKVLRIQNAGVQSGRNQNGLVVVPEIANQNRTGNVVTARAESTGIRNQAKCYNCKGLGHIARNCIARPRRRDAYTSGTQHDKAPIYDSDGSAEVQLNENCYDNKIFNMFTQEEQYTDLLEPIPEPQLVPHNDNHVTSVSPSMVQSEGTIETSFAPNEETRAHQETIYRNLVDQVSQVNMVNRNMRATNAELKYELARYKNQEQRVEIRVFVPQTTRSKEELFLSNVSNMVTVSKMISIPNEDLSDDTTPSVARKFLNEIQFLQEVAKFVRDFKSLANEADESLDKQKYLELEIKRILKASVSHDIMSIVQNGFVDVPSDLQTELDRTKEKLELCIIKKVKEYGVLWNNWYTKCEECKYDKISYDKAYND